MYYLKDLKKVSSLYLLLSLLLSLFVRFLWNSLSPILQCQTFPLILYLSIFLLPLIYCLKELDKVSQQLASQSLSLNLFLV